MTVSNKPLRIMENILHHDDIHALVWMDKDGSVKARRGNSVALLFDADAPTANIRVSDKDEQSPDSLYICQFDGDDFLIVIFDDQAEFDDIKTSVDQTLKR